MHKLVGVVFKVLFISIVLMFVMNISIIVIDTVTVYNRVQSLMGILQKEVVNHNCLRDNTKNYFVSQLEDIKKTSSLVESFETNFDSTLTHEGVSYSSIGESNVRNYGENIDIIIKMNLSANIFLPTKKADEKGFLSGTDFSYSFTLKETVPALRYLK